MNLEFRTRVVQDNGLACVVVVEINRQTIATYEFPPNAYSEAEAEYEAGARFARDLAVHIWRLRQEEASY